MSFSLVARLGRLAGSAALLAALLGGCGGGGSDAAPETGKNNAPAVSMLLSGAVSAGGADADVTASAGADLILSATGSKDADGDAITYKWSIVSKPAGSNLTLGNDTLAQQTVRADVGGDYVFRLRVTDSKGAWAEKDARVKILPNVAPVSNVVVVISPNVTEAASGATTINTSTDYMVALDGKASSDADGQALTYAWSVVSKPADSKAALSSSSGAASQITPDVLGTYQVKLTVKDTLGSSHSYVTTIVVANRRPLASIASNATPVALPTGPAVRMPLGTLLTLRGTSSSDADGDTLVYDWSMVSKPADSTAVLSSAATATVQFTPDTSGSYVVRMRVTDSAGAYSERLLTVEAGNYSPVAVLDKHQVTTLAGSVVSASAANSYDNDGDTLSYAWTLDARPAGSAISLASATASTVAFTPDVPGVYMATVTITDGKSSSVASFYVKALSTVTTNVSLNFAPLDARYSKGLDKMVILAGNPNALKIVDPFTAAIRTVVLPMAVKSMQLSPDGKLAAVLHENILSLVDLEAGTLLRSSATGGAHTDAFVTNTGLTYLIGASDSGWNDHPVTVIDGRTGANMTAALTADMGYGARFYGTQYGIFAPLKNRVLMMSQGLSPADIDFMTIDPVSGKVTSAGESPYHGDYAMSTPLFLSANEELLFTASGTYFYSDTLRYAGSLAAAGRILSMSHSAQNDEALVLKDPATWYGDPVNYHSSYLRFTGTLLIPDTPINLPLIDAQQSYGLKIFHSANASHVALVQTGTALANGTGVKYYVTTR